MERTVSEGRGVVFGTKGSSCDFIAASRCCKRRPVFLYCRGALSIEGDFFMAEERIHQTRLNDSPIFSKDYWRLAAKNFSDVRMLAVAALIIALRIAVKLLKIEIAPGLSITFDCYVNSLGSLCYGPLVGLAVGAVSDTLGYLIHPTGAYFLPFILVEMSSSFIFGLFLWKRQLSPLRVLASKFTVNLVCNIILTSIFMKWSYYWFYGVEKAQAYNLINLVRIGKNLVFFPVEAMLITIILGALTPALKSLKILPKSQTKMELHVEDVLTILGLLLISVAIVLFYLGYLKDFLSLHNVKLG